MINFNFYGFFILIGVFFCLFSLFFFKKYLIKKNLLNQEEANGSFEDYYPVFKNLYFFSFLGGKLFFYLFDYDDSWNSFYDFFTYGFSMLGSSSFALIYYLYVLNKSKNFKLLNYLPIFILLIHGFGRMGCYSSGCCGGSFYGYPIQIVSSIWYFIFFLISILTFKFTIYFFVKKTKFLYIFIPILGITLERIIFDKYRFDCIHINKYFSLHECIAILYIFFFLTLSLVFYNKENDL